MISIIITAYGEPIATERAVNAFIDQDIKEDYEIIVADPFDEVRRYITNKFKGNKRVKYFQDPGKGKSYALNLLLKKIKSDILILTDGDVYVNDRSIDEIINKFKDPKVGCVSGRPVSLNPKNNIIGYWSHFLADVAAHKISRKKRYEQGKFLECSGYLFAFRNIIKEFPLDVAEDSIIPYIFFKKGYKIAYAENAKVYVKNPTNLKDFIKQRTRTAGAHARLKNYYKDFPKVKSFLGEIIGGVKNFKEVWSYPSNLKEDFYLLSLFPVRLYIWLRMYYLKRKQSEYKDGWERVDSTKNESNNFSRGFRNQAKTSNL